MYNSENDLKNPYEMPKESQLTIQNQIVSMIILTVFFNLLNILIAPFKYIITIDIAMIFFGVVIKVGKNRFKYACYMYKGLSFIVLGLSFGSFAGFFIRVSQWKSRRIHFNSFNEILTENIIQYILGYCVALLAILVLIKVVSNNKTIVSFNKVLFGNRGISLLKMSFVLSLISELTCLYFIKPYKVTVVLVYAYLGFFLLTLFVLLAYYYIYLYFYTKRNAVDVDTIISANHDNSSGMLLKPILLSTYHDKHISGDSSSQSSRRVLEISKKRFMNRRSKETTWGKIILGWFTFLIIMLVCAFTSIGVSDWFYSLQKQYVGIKESILFIHSSYSLATIFFGIFALGLLLQFRIFYGKYLSTSIIRIKYSILAIVIVIVTSIILTFSFFDYSVIKEEGIFKSNNLLSERKSYPWNNVNQASVQYYYGKKYRIGVKYILYMYDGQEINLVNSDEFWGNILSLENLFKQKCVKIVRMEVNDEVYMDLKNEFSRPSQAGHKNQFQEVIVKLFDIKQ